MAVWAALLIGTASAPQASASGFQAPYAIPDAATAALGVLLTVAILATARTRGAGEQFGDPYARSAKRHGLPADLTQHERGLGALSGDD